MVAGTRQPVSGVRGRKPSSGGTATTIAKSPPSSPPTDKNEFQFKCFFKHRDPLHTERLSPRYKSCNNVFPSVNRLREHTLRAHSLSHNCRVCRHRTTKVADDFWAKHAASCIPQPATGAALPILLDEVQTRDLSRLNLHFCKPNTEPYRCEKLWNTLFPHDRFDRAVMIRTSGLENQQDHQRAGTSSAPTTRKPKQTTTTPTPPTKARGGPGRSLPTPAPSPPRRVEHEFPPADGMSDAATMFSQVPVPKVPVELPRGEASLVDSAVCLEDDGGSVSGGDAGQKDSSPSSPKQQQGQSRRDSMRMTPEYSPESPQSQYMDLEVPGIDSEIAPPDRPARILLEGEDEEDEDEVEEEGCEGEEDDEEEDAGYDEDMDDHDDCEESDYTETESSVGDGDEEMEDHAHATSGHHCSFGVVVTRFAQCVDQDEVDDILNGGEDSEEDAMSIDSGCFS